MLHCHVVNVFPTCWNRLAVQTRLSWAFAVNTLQYWHVKSVTSGNRLLIDRQIDWLAFGFETLRSRCTYALINGPFVPHINSWGPCCFTKVPDGPQTYTLDVFWLQEKGAQILISEWSQGFTLTENVGRGFFLCCTPGNRVYCTWSQHRYNDRERYSNFITGADNFWDCTGSLVDVWSMTDTTYSNAERPFFLGQEALRWPETYR